MMDAALAVLGLSNVCFRLESGRTFSDASSHLPVRSWGCDCRSLAPTPLCSCYFNCLKNFGEKISLATNCLFDLQKVHGHSKYTDRGD